MELTVISLTILLGIALRRAIYEHQERRIAQQGYQYYIRFSSRWRAKRKACYARFGNRCAVCYSPNNLEAHHRTYRRLYNEHPDDLTCLCRDCHRLFTGHNRLVRRGGSPRVYSSKT